MTTYNYIDESNKISEMIYSFAKRVNRMLRENNVNAWMYDQESFTGASHYLNTKLGKIRLSDHGIPDKGRIYTAPYINVIVIESSEIEKLEDLFNYIQSNINTLF